jgi:hypothetical protein
MSDSGEKKSEALKDRDKNDLDETDQDLARKAQKRGPADCLNWDSDSDEAKFVPFTQIPEVTPKEVFAKKSKAEKVKKPTLSGKKPRVKGSSKSAKGKQLLFFDRCLICVIAC